MIAYFAGRSSILTGERGDAAGVFDSFLMPFNNLLAYSIDAFEAMTATLIKSA